MAAGKSISKRTRRRTLPTPSSLAERVQAEREQLFRAIGIIELCRFATSTLLEVGESEYMIPVFETTCDLLNASAERLEWISCDLQKLSRKDEA